MPAPRTRRAWGWHPLTPEWAERIVAASDVRRGDQVLDLGAGEGALVPHLLALGAQVTAVELHPRRVALLREQYGDQVRVVTADLRDLRLPRRAFRVVASPPYALTTEVVRLLLGSDLLLSADLVVQRAAARRLVERCPRARHAVRYRLELGDPVPRRAFAPPPRVDSRVLRIRR